MFSNLTEMWLSGQGGQYLQSVGPGFKPPPSYSLDFFFFTQYSTVWLQFVYIQPQLLPHLLQRITLIHTTYYFLLFISVQFINRWCNVCFSVLHRLHKEWRGLEARYESLYTETLLF